MVGREDDADLSSHWAGTGDHLLLELLLENELLHVEMKGGDLVRRHIAGPPETYDVRSIARWNPSGRPDWAYYGASETRVPQRIQPTLWNRETRASVAIDIGDGSDEERTWSPDGRDLAIHSVRRDSSDTFVGQDLYVQEVLDGQFGRTFRLDQPSPTLTTSGFWDFQWQP